MLQQEPTGQAQLLLQATPKAAGKNDIYLYFSYAFKYGNVLSRFADVADDPQTIYWAALPASNTAQYPHRLKESADPTLLFRLP